MQREILNKNPAANLRVYVVWFSMLPSDSRSRWGWTSGVLADPRTAHFWDEKKIVGSWLAKQDNPEKDSPGIVWDAFYLYGPDAEWNTKPEPLIVRGATVRDEADKLNEKILPLLNDKAR